jgi:hypothetical protein
MGSTDVPYLLRGIDASAGSFTAGDTGNYSDPNNVYRGLAIGPWTPAGAAPPRGTTAWTSYGSRSAGC